MVILKIMGMVYAHLMELRIDTPTGHEAFLEALEQCGFVNVSNPPIMILNSTKMPQRNDKLLGIAAQVFG
ncbi:hypothetical protein [Rossellomorea sp. LJF3]|uniref:hypothetical protein n=1 Tax=Rossellomorea sp. LJF3 TaxID=3126099 RepID=UPI00300CDAFD